MYIIEMQKMTIIDKVIFFNFEDNMKAIIKTYIQ